jgi:hypothetical protein
LSLVSSDVSVAAVIHKRNKVVLNHLDKKELLFDFKAWNDLAILHLLYFLSFTKLF